MVERLENVKILSCNCTWAVPVRKKRLCADRSIPISVHLSINVPRETTEMVRKTPGTLVKGGGKKVEWTGGA